MSLSGNPKHEAKRSDPDAPTPPDISFTDIRWQFEADIDSKEVQTSPTYSYQWVADQVGHMALGLVAVLIAWLAGDVLRWFELNFGSWPPIIGFILLVVGASGWEWRSFRNACKKIEPLFDSTCDRKDLRDNALAATYYMIVGGLIGLLAVLGGRLWPTLPPWIAVAAIALIVVGFGLAIVMPALYWLRQKIRFQQVGLPFLFRLPEFKLEGFKTEIARQIDQFIRNSGEGAGKHIAIVGELNSGKTSLAVGIATEAAFNNKKARYLTFDKLQQIVQRPKEPPPPRNTRLWPWRESQLVIIDDVVSGVPHSAAGNPGQLLRELQGLGNAVHQSLRRRHTVWCLGADTDTSREWIEKLKQGCGMTDDDLLVVVLEKISDAETPVPGHVPRVRGYVHPTSAHKW
jgi:hypothetical protein